MRNTKLRPMSKKRLAEIPKYNALIAKLRLLCNNRSELTGDWANWESHWNIEGHHINGRTGKRFLDPFGIILVSRPQHTALEERKPIDGHKYTKEDLLARVREIRTKQGFIPK